MADSRSRTTMAASRILIIQGHPDPRGDHFCHALADSYERRAAAVARGAPGRRRAVSTSRCCAASASGTPAFAAAALAKVQQRHRLGRSPGADLPALARRHAGAAQGLPRAGCASGLRDRRRRPRRAGAKLLQGRSARIVVTMGMPAFVYRWYFGAHSIRSLERNILRFVGIAPVRRSLIGLVEAKERPARALAGGARATRRRSALKP